MGSQKQIPTLGLGFLIAIDIIVLVGVYLPSFLMKLRRRRRENLARLPTATIYKSRSLDLERSPHSAKSACHGSTSMHWPTRLTQEEISMIEFRRFIASMSKCIEAKELGLSFTFLDLGLRLGSDGKELLGDFTGRIDSGSMWGIMGASGAGKCTILLDFAYSRQLTYDPATLLNLLMGKTQHTSGRVYINGIQQGIARFVSRATNQMEHDLLSQSPQVQEDHRICPTRRHSAARIDCTGEHPSFCANALAIDVERT